jgi:hypothetical protein
MKAQSTPAIRRKGDGGLSRQQKIAALRKRTRPTPQGTLLEARTLIYPQGSRSTPRPYVIVGPADDSEGVDARIACTSATHLWRTLMEVGAKEVGAKEPAAEVEEQPKQSDDVKTVKVTVHPDGRRVVNMPGSGMTPHVYGSDEAALAKVGELMK